MKNYIALMLVVAVIFGACKNENQTNTESTVTTPKNSTKKSNSLDDRLIIPGERVGLINGQSTEADIIKAYGIDAVKLQAIEVGEGQEQKGMLLFEGTTDELEIVWSFDGQDKPAFVRISHEFSNWKTPNGISTGTKLLDLQAANGMPFTFMGFEWDYSGLITNWNGGQFPKNFTVALAAFKPELVTKKMLGEVELQSNDPKIQELDLRIGAIAVRF